MARSNTSLMDLLTIINCSPCLGTRASCGINLKNIDFHLPEYIWRKPIFWFSGVVRSLLITAYKCCFITSDEVDRCSFVEESVAENKMVTVAPTLVQQFQKPLTKFLLKAAFDELTPEKAFINPVLDDKSMPCREDTCSLENRLSGEQANCFGCQVAPKKALLRSLVPRDWFSVHQFCFQPTPLQNMHNGMCMFPRTKIVP